MKRSTLRHLQLSIGMIAASLALGSAGYAATYTVNQTDGSADFNNLADAVAAATNNGETDDTILITDTTAVTYSLAGTLILPLNDATAGTRQTLTIEATEAAVTIESPSAQAIRAQCNLTLRGLSEAEPITLTQSGGQGQPIINVGGSFWEDLSLNLENVVIQRPEAVPGGNWVNFNTIGDVTMTNVRLVGKAPANGIVIGIIDPDNNYPATAVLNNVSFADVIPGDPAEPGDPTPAWTRIFFSGSSLEVNGATFGTPSTGPGYVVDVAPDMPQLTSITLTDGIFEQGNPTGVGGVVNMNSAVDLEFIDPTFNGTSAGTFSFFTQETVSNITIRGTSDPVNLDAFGGDFIFTRMWGGSFTVENATLSIANPAGFLDAAHAPPSGAFLDDLSVSLTDVTFTNGAGRIAAFAFDFNAPQPTWVDPEKQVTVNAVRTSWSGEIPPNGFPVETFTNNLAADPAVVTFEDCTMAATTAPAFQFRMDEDSELVYNGGLIDGQTTMQFILPRVATFTGTTIQNLSTHIQHPGGPDTHAIFDNCTLTNVGDILLRHHYGTEVTFRNMTLEQNTSFAAPFGRVSNGIINYENVVLNGFGLEGTESSSGGGAGAIINIDRSTVRALLQVLTADAVAPATVTAVNTIFDDPGIGQIISINAGGASGAASSSIELTHCTFINSGVSGGTFLNTDPDHSIITNYSIFDVDGMGAISGAGQSVNVSGDQNVIHMGSASAFPSTGGDTLGALTGTVIGNPQLQPDGTLPSGESIAYNVATNSTTMVDRFGTTRPQGDDRDAGAYEGDGSQPSEVHDWLLF
ncbi:MAG: hypothetical protein JJU11_04600 [Candidatus Sumerlaeia bacterium]|nr:hypothetical protein [Candidatus Sumerlaeia bacterium]